MASSSGRDSIRDAGKAIEQGQAERGVEELWNALRRPHLRREEFRRGLQAMERGLLQLGRDRAAGTIRLYLGEHRRAAALLADHGSDLARIAVLEGDRLQAARHYENVGMLGHAAIQAGLAGDHRGARRNWERLARSGRLARDPYTAGLVQFNLVRACRALEDAPGARRSKRECIYMLEQAADAFEAAGKRERAFDCFQVLIALGRDEGEFENLAEGYLNCIRILRNDYLKSFTLQYYEDFFELAKSAGELRVAASVIEEAGHFSTQVGLPYGRGYMLSAAETYQRLAERAESQGGDSEKSSSAYLSAMGAYNEVGAFSGVKRCAGAMAELAESNRDTERWLGLLETLDGAEDTGGAPVRFPDYLRLESAYPEVWKLDVMEWEQAGDAAEVMGEVLIEDSWPEFTRRRALLCRLYQLALPPGNAPEELADYLGRVEIYASLSPLERLYQTGNDEVRTSVLSACRQLFFKRTFGLVEAGLKDSASSVQEQALRCVRSLHFVHAFDRLVRIFSASPEPQAREAALRSIGKIGTPAAIEFLVDVLRQGDARERKQAVELLELSEHPDTDATLRARIPQAPEALRTQLQQLLKFRGSAHSG